MGDGFSREGGFCHSVAILGFELNQVNETRDQDVKAAFLANVSSNRHDCLFDPVTRSLSRPVQKT